MQKRVLCINSLAVAGRCGLTIALPVLSAMGHEACALPTVVLSTHTGGFGTPIRADTALFCEHAIAHFASSNICFDAIYAGYMAQEQQIDSAIFATSGNASALFFLDPVMGDNGKLYSAMPQELPSILRAAAKNADIITPNETEAAALLGTSYSPIKTKEQAQGALTALSKICSGNIIITGIELDCGEHINACREKNGEIRLLPYNNVNGLMHGTGDLFASVLLGKLLNNSSFFSSAAFAANFVSKCAESQGTDERYGVPFEPFLPLLQQNEGVNRIND